jgi:hypothetical protein
MIDKLALAEMLRNIGFAHPKSRIPADALDLYYEKLKHIPEWFMKQETGKIIEGAIPPSLIAYFRSKWFVNSKPKEKIEDFDKQVYIPVCISAFMGIKDKYERWAQIINYAKAKGLTDEEIKIRLGHRAEKIYSEIEKINMSSEPII